MKKRIEKHYKLTVGNGPFMRNYYTMAYTESQARAECSAWADRLAFEGPIRLLRKKTKTEG